MKVGPHGTGLGLLMPDGLVSAPARVRNGMIAFQANGLPELQIQLSATQTLVPAGWSLVLEDGPAIHGSS